MWQSVYSTVTWTGHYNTVISKFGGCDTATGKSASHCRVTGVPLVTDAERLCGKSHGSQVCKVNIRWPERVRDA
uniref:Uncharacterized protein n=1 Tax=Anguilla anguilla TaxID=7936 RepID=A0A0E9U139_ANGAN